MIFLRNKEFAALVREAAVARAMSVRVLALEERGERLLDTILAMKVAGHELPAGHGEEGFGTYSFDDVEEETTDDQPVEPGPLFPDEVEQEDLDDIARALRF